MKTKILVIDDNRDSRVFLQELLSMHGYAVSVAEDGNEGLRKIRIERPSLVITDILMPGVDGFQLLKEIRRDKDLRDLPIIIYTGTYLDHEDETLARTIGVSRYLIKPLSSVEILIAVREVLEEQGTETKSVLPPGGIDEPVFLNLYNERLVTKLKNKSTEIERARIFLEHLMESIGDGVVVIDRDRMIVHVNTAAAVSLGYEKSEMVGRKCFEMIHRRQSPCEAPGIICPLTPVLDTSETSSVLHTHIDSLGNEQYIEIKASPVKDSSGEIFAMVETYRNIMEKKVDNELVNLVQRLNETQMHLKHMSITDELTGLKNRRYIMERLEEEFQRAKRSGRPLSLMMLDIDHFKQVNDAHGHLFGDTVLREVSLRIRSNLRKHDLVGRVGGEEFLIISPDSEIEDSIITAERIRNIIQQDPISDARSTVNIALSIGLTKMHKQDISGDEVLSRADTALYRAKEEGRNRVIAVP